MSEPATRLTAALAERYRITRELGAGGMATVYLAEDLKHDRKVALKVLKPELAAVLGAERFVVEIKTTASLQHPHILPLFDSGTADGFLFYVMPYLQGETIREKLSRETQFGVDEAVRITREVADALDYAHRHGVIHRDIKPENILLHDGRAIVMDFGIALAVSAAAGGRMTETGLSLGTPHYMSPEQATADKAITSRSDVYSLAAVLYEMLAGQPPHLGGSAQQIIMKIIAEPVQPVTALRKSVSPSVGAALAQALEKLPADRFDTAKAFADALGNPTFATLRTAQPTTRLATTPGWRERLTIPALALAAVLAATTVWSLTRSPAAPPLTRYPVQLPEGKQVAATNWSPLAVSPDGTKLVYMGETGRLFLWARDALEPVELAGTESAFNPFFSPDGRRIGFMAGAPGSTDIKWISLGGGPATTVTGGAGGPGAAWGRDGYIYFDASGVGPLRRAPDTGGPAEDASIRDSVGGEMQHNWPEPLPNGRSLLMVIDRAGPGVNVATTNEVAVLDLATRRHRALMKGVYARYTRTGHILYVTSTGVLMAVPFDQDRMELAGSPVVLLEGIRVRVGGGGVDLTVSENGTLWYGSGTGTLQRTVSWVSRSGVFTAVAPDWGVGGFEDIALSPEGDRLALSIVDAGGWQVWVKELRGAAGRLSKLTFEGVNQVPRWHPAGTELLYIVPSIPKENIRTVRADGTSPEPSVLVASPGRAYTASWSPDRAWVVFETFVQTTNRDIAAIRLGDTAIVSLVATRFSERYPSISPDGRWLLYQSATTSVPEIYVRPFPNVSAQLHQVSSGGGSEPKWSRDGSEIYFVNTSNELTRVQVVRGNTFSVTDQRVLFPLRGVVDWDVAPGGRFIATQERDDRRSSNLVVVENFFEELRAKVPK